MTEAPPPQRPDPSPAERIADRWVRRGGHQTLRPRNAAYLIVICWLFAVVVFGVVEHLVDPATFPTVWLGMWWALETVTTVGYGDVVPQQTVGKVIASFLLLGGLALLSVVTATITSAFVESRQRERRAAGDDPVIARLDEISRRLDALEERIEAGGRTD
ncbi:MAG: potassium channel family protein [Solirubrobacteraceae bacterium]